MKRELLSPTQMASCDAYTIEAGTPGPVLMERAGEAIADVAKDMLPAAAAVIVLTGPGNNGGDGYVVARLLREYGANVAVFALDIAATSGDAVWALERWGGKVEAAEVLLEKGEPNETHLVIDALFGAGLKRALSGAADDLASLVNTAKIPVLAVDLPSGLDGRTGRPLGRVIQADRTVTFHRLKPGHVLYPGHDLCGEVTLADIGLDERAISASGYTASLTGPYLAKGRSELSPSGHKYTRGHALVVGGLPDKAGAGFLAATAALRAGAGLVTFAARTSTVAESVGLYPSLMRATCDNQKDLSALLANPKVSACVLGPGLPPDETTRQLVYAALDASVSLLLDAGALTAFAGLSSGLFARIKERDHPVVVTPHEGEFTRLLGHSEGTSKIERCEWAARQSGATVVLKGPDTVIAHPSGATGTSFINANAPPWLATAGSGDVLAGIIVGLLAGLQRQGGRNVAEAAALGAWLHGDAARRAGPGMIASDLEMALRGTMAALSSTDFTPLEAHQG
ncbi:MAG: NAD(P)H-hydrate dehydratase [Pseudomonadota bacterium]